MKNLLVALDLNSPKHMDTVIEQTIELGKAFGGDQEIEDRSIGTWKQKEGVLSRGLFGKCYR